MPRAERRAALLIKLGRLGLDLVNVVGGRRAVNSDAPRLHRLGDLADQLNREQSVVEGRALHLNIVRQVELPLEMPGRDAPVKEVTLGLLGLAAFNGDDVLLGSDGNLVGRETGDRQRDLVPVIRQTFDVVRGIGFLGGPLGRFGEVKQTIETYGRSE
jgi:hypothetical protein